MLSLCIRGFSGQTDFQRHADIFFSRKKITKCLSKKKKVIVSHAHTERLVGLSKIPNYPHLLQTSLIFMGQGEELRRAGGTISQSAVDIVTSGFPQSSRALRRGHSRPHTASHSHSISGKF